MKEADQISLFLSLFRGREDVVPRYWHSAKSGKSGYAPVCANEWIHPECRKGRVFSGCAGCVHLRYAPLSRQMIRDHFAGRHILGVYPLLPDHRCCFIAADFDNHCGTRNPLLEVKKFYEVCEFQDLPCYVLRSRSGAGYHAFFFFEHPVPAAKARAVTSALLDEAGVNRESDSAFDRLFPAQDRLSGKGFGSLIALPFQGKAGQKGHTLFLRQSTGFAAPYPDQWGFLKSVRKISESDLNQIMDEWRLWETGKNQFAEQKRPSDSIPDFSIQYPPADFDQIANLCPFIAHCRDDAARLSEPDWYILLTISARCTDGRRLSHKLSAPYPHYTWKETEAKISRALNCTGPYRCQTVAVINRTYCKACFYYGKIRSPIVLGHRKYGLSSAFSAAAPSLDRKKGQYERALNNAA
ncbi:MAG: hypothetical protein AB7S75_25315 [Desulfococcaceae bacterium]